MSTKARFKSYNQNDSLLLPPSLGELTPSTHPVRIFNKIRHIYTIVKPNLILVMNLNNELYLAA